MSKHGASMPTFIMSASLRDREAEPEPVFYLRGVRVDVVMAREKALKLGPEVCHVEEADGKLELVTVKESRRRLSNDAD